MSQLIVFAIGISLGLFSSVFIMSSNIYKFYKEKNILINKIKRLENLNSENELEFNK
jgi:hypothetical protein